MFAIYSQAQVALRGSATTATSSGTTLTIAAPAGIVQGDILIANIATIGTASAASLSGWTVIRSASFTTSPRRYATVLYKIAGPSEPASYSFSTGSGTIGASGGVLAFSGVDNTNPFDVATPTIRRTTSTTVTASGVTTARTNTAIVYLGQAIGIAGGASISWNTSGWRTVNAPGALTELYDVEEATNRVSVGAAWGTRAAIGSTGNGTVTITSSVRNGGVLVALRAQDVFPPVVSARSPASGATGVAITSAITADFNEPMTASTIDATTAFLQAGSTLIPATVAYSTTNRRVTITPSMPLAARTTYTVSLKGGSAGIKDLAGLPLAADNVWSFTTSSPSDQTAPTVTSTIPGAAATGVALSTTISAVFSEALNTSTVNTATAFLQNGATTVPASVAYNSTTRTVTLTPSAPLIAGTTYTATIKGGVLGIKDAVGNPLAVDRVWTFTTIVAGATAPTVVSTVPASNATGVAITTAITATVSKALDATTVNGTNVLLQSGAVSVPATLAYTPGTTVITITPSSSLNYSTTYTATLKGGSTGIKDVDGNALAADYVWSFTTVANTTPNCPCNVFTSAQQTQASSSETKNDGMGGIQVGMKFRASVDGFVSGVRFYKSTSNTGTHIGQLWSSTGTLLAQATFVNETASGWQQVSFANPVSVTANVTYVISYHSSAGNYAFTGNYFSGMTANGPLRALSNGEDGGNGVYRYTNTPAFPNSTYSSSNYWVDVVFTSTAAAPDVTPPTVVSTFPASNAVSVSTGTSIQATFSEALNASTVTGTNAFIRAGSTNVAATVSYVSASQQVTIIPTSALSATTTYTVTLKGGNTGISDVAGNRMASDYTWSFTTAEAAPPPPPPPPPGEHDIAAENTRAGNPISEWDISGAGDPSIQGFATEMSVNRGSTVRFKINVTGTNTTYNIRIYRLGYYQGNGARLITDLGNFTGVTQSAPMVTENIGLVDCGNWSESASWSVPADAVSGVYIAKLTRLNNGGASHIVFVVRNDASTAPIMFKTSDATWQAYNSYGGYSFYTGSTSRPSGRADKISYNRPFDTRSTSSQDFLFNAEYPMIRWMERNGYHMTYVTDVDMERNTTTITPAKHKILLSVGHDEYWSANMRNNYETARNNGVHLAFFSGNEVYWKTRWENNYRTLVCYKEGAVGQGEYNCGGNCDPLTGVWTGLWRYGCEYGEDGCRPENALTGQISWTESYLPIQVPYEYRNHPFWRNTSIRNLQTGQVATLTNYTLGYEWDYENAAYASSNPPGRVTLSSTTFNGLTHRMSIYTHSSGAQVFGAGTVQWSWGLDNVHDRGNPTPSFDMQQATVNLFYDMGVQPATPQAGIVLAAASGGDQVPPASVINSPANGASLQANQAVTVSGTASDAGGVSRVDVSFNGGVSWQAATGTTNWSYSWTPTASGSYVIRSRAVDNAGNTESLGTSPSANAITVTVSGGSSSNPCPCTVFNGIAPTGSETKNDGSPLNLGMKFIPSQSGYITGLRFYKASTNTGTHTGQLYSSSGTLLASAVFTSETASGWQQVNLSTPVAVTAGATYVVSYHSSSGYYSLNENYFTSAIVNGPLTAPASGSSGGNGVYLYSASPGRPVSSWNASNYWVDVVFNTTLSTVAGNTGDQNNVTDVSGNLTQTGNTGNQYMLSQNTPNPASSITSIQYRIPARTQVRLMLYDMQGRLVRVLVDAWKEPGDHQQEIDTRTLGKGVYLYRMQADGFTASKRMVVE
jgi:hypothetical protein